MTLTMEEESMFEGWIVDIQQRGIPITKEKLADSVKQFLDANPRPSPFNNNRPSLLSAFIVLSGI